MTGYTGRLHRQWYGFERESWKERERDYERICLVGGGDGDSCIKESVYDCLLGIIGTHEVQ